MRSTHSSQNEPDRKSTLRSSNTHNDSVYESYAYRYIIAGVFTLCCIANAVQWFEFIPIFTQVKHIFNVSSTNVSLSLVVISQLLYIPSTFFSNFMIEKIGFKNSIIFAAFLTAFGAGLRCLCQFNYYFLLAGSIFAGMAQPFFATNCQKISAIWFPSTERALSTTIILCFYNLGNAIGSQLPIIVPNTTQLFGLVNMLYISAGFCGLVFILALLLFREEPPSPPSRGAKKKKFDFYESLKSSFHNMNLLIWLVSVSVFQGVYIALSTTMDLLFEPLGIQNYQISNIVTISVFAGTVQSLLLGIVVSKTSKYKTLCIVTRFVTTLCYGGLIIASFELDQTLIEIFLILYMSLATSANPATFEMIVELSFPIAEEVTGSLFTLGYRVFGGVFSIVIDLIIESPETQDKILLALLIFLGLSFLTLILSLFVKEIYKRSMYERKGSKGLTDIEVDLKNNLDIDFRYSKF